MRTTGHHHDTGHEHAGNPGDARGELRNETRHTAHGSEYLEIYAGSGPRWSGEANHTLVVEAARLAPGRALDVGSGEGADSIWLASWGWSVTGVEPSPTAFQRARAAGEAAGVVVDWFEGTLDDAELAPRTFDLVSCFYPSLPRGDGAAERLADLVAPGGTLLMVTHADVDPEHARGRGFDPELFLDHAAVRDALGEGWTIVTDEKREREIHGGEGAHHHADLVLVALREN